MDKDTAIKIAIGDLLDMKEHWCADSTDQDAISIDLAIDALRQMRTEPCEWQLSCGYEEFEEHITGCGVVFTFIGDEMKNIHYCPNCGKLVTE